MSLLVHTIVGSLSASVDGHELAGRDTTLLDAHNVRWSFDFYAPPPEGVVVTLDFAAGPRVLLRAVDFTYGPAGRRRRVLPGPAGRDASGRLGDGTLTEATLRLPAASPLSAAPRRRLRPLESTRRAAASASNARPASFQPVRRARRHPRTVPRPAPVPPTVASIGARSGMAESHSVGLLGGRRAAVVARPATVLTQRAGRQEAAGAGGG